MGETPKQTQLILNGVEIYLGSVVDMPPEEQTALRAAMDEWLDANSSVSPSDIGDLLDAIDKLIDAFRVFNYL